MNSPLIRFDNVSKIYGHGVTAYKALNHVNFEVPAGAFWAIMGPSGSGKSTLLHILGLLDRPSDGQFTIGMDTINANTNLSELARLRKQQIGFIFQQFFLLPRLSALDNVLLPAVYAKENPKVARSRARELLEEVGLGNRDHHRPNELSGGEQQRVAIARALMNDPALILADEPTGNLDSKTGAGIIKLIKKLHSSGKTILVVTHDQEISDQTEEVIRIRDGEIQ